MTPIGSFQKEVLAILIHRDTALTVFEIQESFSDRVVCPHRSQIYNALSSLKSRGLVRELISDTGDRKYALCLPADSVRDIFVRELIIALFEGDTRKFLAFVDRYREPFA